MVYLHHDGDVWCCPPATVRIPCSMDLTNYPFDSQVCRMRFALLTYGDEEVRLGGESIMSLSVTNQSSEWQISFLDTSQGRLLNNTSLDIAIGMKRRGTHHRYTATLPWIALVIMMLLGFWMPANSSRRLTLACINLLLVMLMLQRITVLLKTSSAVPKIDETPYEEYVSHRQLLRAKLFDPSKYDVNRRPDNGTSSATNVSLHLFWEYTTFMNLEDGWLSLSMVTCNNWYDTALEWDPEDYGGLESISTFPSEIWYPDIEIVNTSPDDYTTETITVYLHHDGEIWFCQPVMAKIPCSMDLTDYPFDSQVCRIRFALLAYGDEEVRLGGEGTMSHSVTNQSSEWQVTFLDTSHGTLLNKTTLDMAIGMKRRGTHHRYTATLPWVASVIMMLLGFWMPANSSRRLTLACINLLLIMLMLQRITVLLKTSSAVPKLAFFLGNVMVVQVVAAVVAVLVLNMESSTMPSEVPEPVVRFLTGSAGRFLCLAQEGSRADQSLEDSENPFPAKRNDLEKKCDWMLVAQAFDRLFFALFSIVTLCVMPW
ncbi:neurotransmitter gated ion channel, putative [Ixodes scapularis]|uniref:Neurotransmitter gated ion channel, putative n=2 Tax=Ixodes scapularis TaxID=6945 RepID=B7QBV5_IXOSC|nr:neurotransmitter gated ion channel, putative [Ixodes scapularis]|eukprot:XP_002413019.1 neurotransmitter gated ion channel, putative [Ixodes scapularis]